MYKKQRQFVFKIVWPPSTEVEKVESKDENSATAKSGESAPKEKKNNNFFRRRSVSADEKAKVAAATAGGVAAGSVTSGNASKTYQSCRNEIARKLSNQI
jgi:hypothetical protein